MSTVLALLSGSTEIRVLHEEGEQLSKLLKKAFPNDNRTSWTYADLDDAVQKSRHAWESKERVGHGKPQKLFHSLMRKFDAHSNLFQFIPSGNMYASVVTGATAMLVKASVNHSKTIEELSNALDAITEAVSIGDGESTLIKSVAMQNAVAKLYIAIFLFLGDAATWYKSSAATKVVHSLHKNFSERFKQSIATIKEQAANVRYVAQLGSQAEVRVVRLEVEELQTQLQDIRIGMSGEVRKLAEYLHAQHGQNMKQHEKTQELLAEYKSVGMLPAPAAAERDYQDLIRPTERNALIEAPPSSPTSHERNLAQFPPEEGAFRPKSEAALVVWGEFYRMLNREKAMFQSQKARGPFLIDGNVHQALRKWLATPSSLMYMEFISTVSGEDVIHEINSQLRISLRAAKSIVVPQFSNTASFIRSNISGQQQQAACLITYIAYQIDSKYNQLDDGREVYWNQQTNLKDISFENAVSLLSKTLSGCSVPLLHIIIPAHPFLSYIDSSQCNALLKVLRANMYRHDMALRVIFLTHIKITNLLPHLHPDEMALLRQQTGKQRHTKVPLVVSKEDSDDEY